MKTRAPLLVWLVACGSKEPPTAPTTPTATATASASEAPPAASTDAGQGGSRYLVGPEVEPVFDARRPDMQRCADDAKSEGRAKLTFTVAADGKVTDAKASDASGFNPAALDCIVAVLRTMTFRQSKLAVTFTLPFRTTSANRRLSGPDEPLPEMSPDLESVVARARPTFRRCYDTALASDPTLRGRFVVAFVVANDGAVSSAKAEKQAGTLTPAIVDCVLAKVKTLRFAPHAGKPTDVNQPINFEPKP